jgi:hypothetical protein
MAILKHGWLAHRSMDIWALFTNAGNGMLILTVTAIVLPILYFACLYAWAR